MEESHGEGGILCLDSSHPAEQAVVEVQGIAGGEPTPYVVQEGEGQKGEHRDEFFPD